MKVNSPNESHKYFLIAVPVTFAIIFIAFWGIWEGYHVGDDAGAVKMIERINEGNPTNKETIKRMLFAVNGSHWTPISTSIVYLCTINDSNFRIAIVNLSLLMICAVLAGYFCIVLGAPIWASIICPLFIGSSQALIVPLSSCWGVTNILPTIFLICQSIITWKWMFISFDSDYSKFKANYIIGFVLCLFLALLTKETGIKGFFLLPFLLFTYFHSKNRYYLRDIAVLGVLCIIIFIGYLYLRQFYTNAPTPLLSPSEGIPDYQVIKFSLMQIFKNASFLLLGSVNVIDSYSIYLSVIKGNYIIASLGMLPAILSLFSLSVFAFSIVGFQKNRWEKKISIVFILLMVAYALFPEVLLGKVSEMYVMSTLCYISILAILVIGHYVDKINYFKIYKSVILMLLLILIGGNIYSSRIRVGEILISGKIAHNIRQDMIRLTNDIPANSRIVVIYNPERLSTSFSRFGEKGIQAGTATFLSRPPHSWIFIKKQKAKDVNLSEYDRVLIEDDTQTGLLKYNSYKESNIERFILKMVLKRRIVL